MYTLLGINNHKYLEWRFNMKTLDYIVLILVIVGTINWGLIGLLNFDLVRVLFGDMTLLSRIVYVIIGVCGLYSLSFFGRVSTVSD